MILFIYDLKHYLEKDKLLYLNHTEETSHLQLLLTMCIAIDPYSPNR